MIAPDSRYLIARMRPACLVLLMSVIALAIGNVPVALANTITVNSLLDTPDPGKCRLRDAITAANNHTTVNTCQGAPGLDTINFNLNAACRFVQCTLQLAGPLPVISETVTINGSPYGVAISGVDQYVVFSFDSSFGSSVVVNLSNLAVVSGKGDFGAGIIMTGTTLTLNNVRLAGNHAHSGSGIYESSGTLYVFNSRFLGNIAEASGFGGALGQNGGAAVISNTVFSSNTAGSGGAVGSLAVSHLQVTTSSFDGNSANIWGGAIYLQDDTVQAIFAGSTFTNNQALTSTASYGGGAIYDNHGALSLANSTLANNASNSAGGALRVLGGTVTLTNVTLSGNTARRSGGGLYVQNDGLNNLATMNLNNVTITDNTADSDNNNTGDGGGIGALDGTVNVLNSIIAGNFDTPSNSGAGTVHPDCSGTFASPTYNLIGRDDGCLGFVNGSNGNLVGTAGSPLDPLLAPLSDNGGSTFTHALLAGSPAVNAANPLAPGSGGLACAGTDQRGVIRPLGPRCDMGAYEAGQLLFLPLIRR